jgi:3-oxoacyl-[acyl-carrier-protein] synthase III
MIIKAIEYYLPEKILDNKALEIEFPEWKAEKVFEKIGINLRHITFENETALDLAEHASNLVLKNYDKGKIDFLLLCTQSPDYFLPTSACILQNRLDLSTNAGALDFNLGCSGFIYGLAIAKGLIKAKIAKHILFVTSETYSKHLNPKDKGNRSIFGDGAAATIIAPYKQDNILDFELGTDGSGMNNLIVKNGGFRSKKDAGSQNIEYKNERQSDDNYLYMNGPEIFNFTLQRVPAMVKRVLEKNSLTMNDIDYFIFHQANKYMLDYLREKLGIPVDKFYQDMTNTGNTVSATIPIALKDCLTNKKIKPGDRILLAGFGVGYSWGSTIIQL